MHSEPRRARRISLGLLALVLTGVVAGTQLAERFRRAPGEDHALAEEADPSRALPDLGDEAERVRRLLERVQPARRDLEAGIERSRVKHGGTPNPDSIVLQDRLAADLLAQLGPIDYDWVLYASGIENRVVVRSVRDDADGVELLAGDVITRYGGQRVYTRADLRRGQVANAWAVFIETEVSRGAERLVLRLPGASLALLGVEVEARAERPAQPVGSGPTLARDTSLR